MFSRQSKCPRVGVFGRKRAKGVLWKSIISGRGGTHCREGRGPADLPAAAAPEPQLGRIERVPGTPPWGSTEQPPVLGGKPCRAALTHNTKFSLSEAKTRGMKTPLTTGQRGKNGRTKPWCKTGLISLWKALYFMFVCGSVRLHLAQAVLLLP